MRRAELDKLKDLRNDCQQYRELFYTDARWDELEGYWSNEPPIVKGKVLSIPMLISDAQRQKAQLVGAEPRIEVTSRLPDNYPHARVMTSMQNQLNRDTDLFGEIEMSLQDTITLGTGFILEGFGSQYGTHRDTPLIGFDPSREGEDKRRIEWHDNIYEDMPWQLRVHPTDILVPPYTIDLKSSYGFFHRYMRNKEEVAADPKLSSRYRGEVPPNAAAYYKGKYQAGFDSLENMIIMWDWYDLRNRHRVTFTEDYPFALFDDIDEILLRLDRLPLHEIIFNRNSRHFWGTADFDLQEPLQMAVNEATTLEMLIRRGEVPMIFLDRTMFDDPEISDDFKKWCEQYLTDQPNRVLALDPGGTKKVADAVYQFKPGQQTDLAPQIERLMQHSRELVGMATNQRGELATGRRTRHEVALADSRFQQSLNPRRRIIKKMIEEIALNRAKMIFDFWTSPRMAETYDAAGNQVTVEFKGADLRGDYQYEVSIESMRAKTQEEQMQQATMIFDKLSPQAVQNGPINVATLDRQWLLHIGATEWNVDALFNMPQPQQMPFDQFQAGFNPQQQPQQQANLAGPITQQMGAK